MAENILQVLGAFGLGLLSVAVLEAVIIVGINALLGKGKDGDG